MTKSELLKYIDERLTQRSDGNIGLLMVRQYVSENMMEGKWIKISPAGIYECSVCGKNVMTADIEVYDFCHGCGAEMKGEEE